MQWHNREKDWYNAERRFIFAAPTPQLRAMWIKLIITGKKEKKKRKKKGKKSANNRRRTASVPDSEVVKKESEG